MIELDHEDIYEILITYILIKKYISKINEKINLIFGGNDEEENKSLFDEYDKENGYEDEKVEEYNLYENSLSILNELFKIARKSYNNSLKECLDMDIIDLLEFINFSFKDIEVQKEDYSDEDE